MIKTPPFFSIITASFNSQKTISKTIESLLNQDYTDFEYIIIDGDSLDRTKEIISKYNNYIDVYVSEKDKGIYDAMNKAIDYCSGDYILFLNSGDKLYEPNTVSKIINEIIQIKPDILLGSYNYVQDISHFNKTVHVRPLNYYFKGMVTNHQSCLFKRQIHAEFKYDLRFKLVADYHLLLKLFLDGKYFFVSKETISIISVGGLSDNNRFKVLRENLKVQNELSPSIMNYLFYSKSIVYQMIIRIIKLVINYSKSIIRIQINNPEKKL